jgi:hypothetical protein
MHKIGGDTDRSRSHVISVGRLEASVNRGKAGLAALLVISSVTLIMPPATAQVYPTCPPGYY